MEWPHNKGRNTMCAPVYTAILCIVLLRHLGVIACVCPFMFGKLYKYFIHNQVFSIYRHFKTDYFSQKSVFNLSVYVCFIFKPIRLGAFCSLFPSTWRCNYLELTLHWNRLSYCPLREYSWGGKSLYPSFDLSTASRNRNYTAKSSLKMLSHFWSGGKAELAGCCAAAAQEVD